MATHRGLVKGMGQKKVKMIAKRFDISPQDAKRFFFDRKASRLAGKNLTFNKWKRKNLNFEDTVDGNDIEAGDFDNFFSRKRRKKLKRKLRGALGKRRGLFSKLRRVKRGILSGGISELMKRRGRKVRRHKGLLKKLANPLFMANPRNARAVGRKVKRMAIGIKRNDDRLIRMKKRNIAMQGDYGGQDYLRPTPSHYPPPRYHQDYAFEGNDETFLGFDVDDNNGYDYADGTQMTLMQKAKKYKWFLVGGAVAFLFLTPMGKKLIGQK